MEPLSLLPSMFQRLGAPDTYIPLEYRDPVTSPLRKGEIEGFILSPSIYDRYLSNR